MSDQPTTTSQVNGIRMTTSHSGATAIAMAVLLTLGLLVVILIPFT